MALGKPQRLEIEPSHGRIAAAVKKMILGWNVTPNFLGFRLSETQMRLKTWHPTEEPFCMLCCQNLANNAWKSKKKKHPGISLILLRFVDVHIQKTLQLPCHSPWPEDYAILKNIKTLARKTIRRDVFAIGFLILDEFGCFNFKGCRVVELSRYPGVQVVPGKLDSKTQGEVDQMSGVASKC